MNFKDRLISLMKVNARVSIYIVGETEGYIVGFIAKVEEDFLEIQMKERLKIVPLEKIGYLSV